MTESDSSNPQKVAALAAALEGVRRHIGFGSELDLTFRSWLHANATISDPWNPNPEDAESKEVLAAAANFLEAIDNAERVLNALPESVLKPLSALIGGVPWDMRTRRTLKAIQDEQSDLRWHSMKPKFFLAMLRAKGKARFDESQLKLRQLWPELGDRILDLKSLPYDLDEETKSNTGKRSSHQACGVIPITKAQSEGCTVVPSLTSGKSTKTVNQVPEKSEESPPPKYDPNSADWMLSETLCTVLGIKACTITEYRKPRKCGSDRVDEFGKWNVDRVGKFRRNVNRKKSVAYYRPAMSDTYKAKLVYAESQKNKMS